VAWPGWQPLPELIVAAGGQAVPVAPAPAEILARVGPSTGAVGAPAQAAATWAVSRDRRPSGGGQVYVAPGRRWGDERHVRAALRGPAAVDRLPGALLAR
jgi:hypothetical protein